MQIGRLTERIELQRVGESRGAQSREGIETVVETIQDWAQVEILISDEARSSIGETYFAIANFTIRYFDRFDPRHWRIKTADNRIWDAVAMPKEIERKAYMIVKCGWTGREVAS